MISSLYSRGGFDLVLGVTAVVGARFRHRTVLIAVFVHGVERELSAVQPAE